MQEVAQAADVGTEESDQVDPRMSATVRPPRTTRPSNASALMAGHHRPPHALVVDPDGSLRHADSRSMARTSLRLPAERPVMA